VCATEEIILNSATDLSCQSLCVSQLGKECASIGVTETADDTNVYFGAGGACFPSGGFDCNFIIAADPDKVECGYPADWTNCLCK
jgi:hypothetical protein